MVFRKKEKVMTKNLPDIKFQNMPFQKSMAFENANLEHLLNFPYPTKISFLPLLNYWKGLLESGKIDERILAQEIFKRLKKIPQLEEETIEDETLLEKHKDVVELMLSGFFSSIQRKKLMGAANRPFTMMPFYKTPALHDFFDSGVLNVCFDMEIKAFQTMGIIEACSLILNRHYGQKIDVEPSYIYTMNLVSSNTKKHYKTQIDLDFLKVVPIKPLQEISQEQINQMLKNIYDVDFWLKMLPPENFEFRGVAMERLIDITEEETLSQMKYKLLEKDAIVRPENVKELEQDLKTYFGISDLRMGITAIDYPAEFEIAHKYKIRYDFLFKNRRCLLSNDGKGSLYEKACKWNEMLIIEDLNKYDDGTNIPKELIQEGIKSIIITPLVNKDRRVIGLLEIGAPQPFQLTSLEKIKLKAVAPLFCMSLERSREEIDNRIEAIMREEFTALHPSVEWKFIREAFEVMEKREGDPDFSDVEEIGFEDVYPLYGQADIVGSSNRRNQSIQTDLLENLDLLKKVLQKAINHISFPLLDQKLLLVEKNIQTIVKGISTDDETRVLEFIRNEIHPLLEEIKERNPEVRATIVSYFNKIDPELGFIYKNRKRYEESVARVNETISQTLMEAEKDSQKMIPHYFDEYKTDGVEYDIYVGQSLLKDEKFNEIHLHNLRLWQLHTMIDITRNIEKLKTELEIPLDTAQLIFVYGNPLSIVFRLDEKRFDVDGAYNVRYEIIKKRIDKARIQDTNERLTVKGKIAIAYTSEKDKIEYLGYLNYLKERNYLTGEIEDLTLAKMQGVEGLRALRVTVAM